jgi:hypothetical protein
LEELDSFFLDQFRQNVNTSFYVLTTEQMSGLVGYWLAALARHIRQVTTPKPI